MNQELIRELHGEWRALVQAIGAKMKPILQTQDLTKVDGIVMMTVKKRKTRTKAELAEHLNFEPASLTRSLNRLVKRGLLHRYPDPADKRFARLELTDSGKILTLSLEKAMLSIWQTAFKDTVDAEIKIFIKLLQNTKRNLSTRTDNLDQK